MKLFLRTREYRNIFRKTCHSHGLAYKERRDNRPFNLRKFHITPIGNFLITSFVPLYEDRNVISNNVMSVPSFAFSSVKCTVKIRNLQNQVVLKLFSYVYSETRLDERGHSLVCFEGCSGECRYACVQAQVS